MTPENNNSNKGAQFEAIEEAGRDEIYGTTPYMLGKKDAEKNGGCLSPESKEFITDFLTLDIAHCEWSIEESTTQEYRDYYTYRKAKAEKALREIDGEGSDIADLVHTLEVIQDAISDVMQDEFENGVKWLSENAADEFKKRYPEISGFMEKTSGVIDAAIAKHKEQTK